MNKKSPEQRIIESVRSVHKESVESRMIRLTVNDIMTWYGGEDWATDWKTTNSMTVNGEHAQTKDDVGKWALEHLTDAMFDEVEVTCTDGVNAYDISFDVNGMHFEMQAVNDPCVNYMLQQKSKYSVEYTKTEDVGEEGTKKKIVKSFEVGVIDSEEVDEGVTEVTFLLTATSSDAVAMEDAVQLMVNNGVVSSGGRAEDSDEDDLLAWAVKMRMPSEDLNYPDYELENMMRSTLKYHLAHVDHGSDDAVTRPPLDGDFSVESTKTEADSESSKEEAISNVIAYLDNLFNPPEHIREEYKYLDTAGWEEGLWSDELRIDISPEEAGALAPMFSEIYCLVSIGHDSESGDVHMMLNYDYHHPGGGHNGKDIHIVSRDNGKTFGPRRFGDTG